jgi:hypothetical protein
MNILLKLVRLRSLIILAAIFSSLWFLRHFGDYPQRFFEVWLYPPQQGLSPEGMEILAEIEKHKSLKVVTAYRHIWGLLDEAARGGSDVKGLRAKAKAALALNEPAYRREALKALAEVEMAIPQRKTKYIPYSPSQEEEEIPADIKPSRIQKRAGGQ